MEKNMRKMEETQHIDEQVEDLDEAEEVIPYTYAITSYGADYPVDALVRRLRSGDIIVPTFDWTPDTQAEVVGFQRDYVWPKPKADKFIESLLLGLPVPGIFLVKEETGRLLVLDGHQRLHTLRAYYGGIIKTKEYRLESVQPRFKTKRFKDLDTADRRRLDDSIIHATIVRQDVPEDNQESIYMIFERLNTGGLNLQPQEIRVALYHGKLVTVLKNLNEKKAWRVLFGNKSKRLKDMELILRFFAFYYYAKQYRAPMKSFLNRYMASNRNLERQSEEELTKVFRRTTSILKNVLGRRAFRPKGPVNAAVVDSLMTGVAKRLERGDITKADQLRRQNNVLLSDSNYTEAIRTGTSQEANVKTRMRIAETSFAEIG